MLARQSKEGQGFGMWLRKEYLFTQPQILKPCRSENCLASIWRIINVFTLERHLLNRAQGELKSIYCCLLYTSDAADE